MKWKLTAPDGRTVIVSGDKPPTEEDARKIFAALPPPQQPQRGGIFAVAARGTATEQTAPGQSGIVPVDPVGVAQVVRGFGEGLLHVPVPEQVQPATLYRKAAEAVLGKPATEVPRGTERERVAKMVGQAIGVPGIAGAAVGGAIKGTGALVNMLRAMAQGGVTAGASAETPEEVPLAAAGGAAAGGALSVVGQGVGALFRRLGRLNKPALKLIADKGVKAITDPELMQPDYVGRVVVPEIKRDIVSTITNPGTETRKAAIAKRLLGITDADMALLQKVRPETLQSEAFLNAVTSNNADEISAFVARKRESANDMYGAGVKEKLKGKLINVKDTLAKLRKELAGRVDDTGRVVKKFLPGTEPTRDEKRLLKIYETLVERQRQTGLGNVFIRPDEYQLLRQTAQEIAQAQPTLARAARELYHGIADDAADILPALKKANKAYAEAKALEELEPKLKRIADIDGRINAIIKKGITSNFKPDVDAAEELVGKETLDKVRISALWEAIRAPERGAPGTVSGGTPGLRESIELGTTPLMRAANIHWYGRPWLRSAARQAVLRPAGVAAGEATREAR